MNKLNEEELKRLHGKEYVKKYHDKDKIRIKRLFKEIKLSKNSNILDLGCGNGLLLNYLKKEDINYFGVDFSKEFIEEAKKRVKNNEVKQVNFYCGDVVQFCKNSSINFENCFALDFVEHIYNEDFLKIFSTVYKSMKKNGELYLHTPNGDFILEILKKKGIMKQFPEHIGIRKDSEYLILLKKVGFEKIRIIYLSHYIKILVILDFLKYLPFLGKYFKARLFIICKK